MLDRITHELLGQLAFRDESFKENPMSTAQMGDLIDLVQASKVTGVCVLYSHGNCGLALTVGLL